ncbi:MAG: regulatory protein RecX [Clostridiales bacterium]|jgi:regulatory protein|nr:regulatory protein RecX [Clostridiales bacterium]
MTITDIVEINIGPSKKKTAYRIYIDYEYAFLLYRQDIKGYQLELNKEISLELIDRIIEETVYRRAKQKAMAILKRMDKTEKELYDKLRQAYYTDIIIERTIEYLKGYKYIDDKRYSSNYIRMRKNTMSKLSIRTKLLQKGINKEVLEEIIAIEYDMDSNETDPEILAIEKAIQKKYKDITVLSFEERQKLIASLYRKGFDLDKIHKCLNYIKLL